jgi:hypothetical protein
LFNRIFLDSFIWSSFNKGIRYLSEQTNKQIAICSYGISSKLIKKVNEIAQLPE